MNINNKTVIDKNIVDLDSLEYIVPSANLPPNLKLQNANDILDATIYRGDEYLAFRDAPYHWPTSKAKIYVIKRKIGDKKWELSFEYDENKDLREPRLLSWNNHLYLYFAVLSGNFATFEPLYMKATVLGDDGKWSAPIKIFKANTIPFRTKVINGQPYMTAYSWNKNSVAKGYDPSTVYFLTTNDGFNWYGVDKNHPVLNSGSEETDFVIDDEGRIYGLSRNDFKDEMDWGSKLCIASKDSVVSWSCVLNKKKFDGPLMFLNNDQVYIIARRNLTKNGDFNLGLKWLPDKIQTLIYNLYYWLTPKRCSLWKLDKSTFNVSFVSDLPSKGDTCYSAINKINGSYYVYNYTSPINGWDLPWFLGQFGKTQIYRIKLNLP